MTDEPQTIDYRAAQKRHDDLRATVEIVTAVAVRLAPDQLPELVTRVYGAVSALGGKARTGRADQEVGDAGLHRVPR